MPDSELTNYRSSISVSFTGVKGTDYMEEYFFHDKLVCDRKVVYILDSTNITLTHNANNCAWTDEPAEIIGADGGGTIRYRVDKDLHWGPQWAGGVGTQTFLQFGGGSQTITNSLNPAYSAPFSFSDLEYEAGVAVVGTTGPKPATAITNWGSYYYRGVLDSVGDEWHTIAFADDDSELDILSGTGTEQMASDGKEIYFVVNPKTPCLTVRATGNGQFYTTVPKNYFIPKIHNQTTYFNAGTGTVTFELKALSGVNVFYRINGGSWIEVNNPTLTQDDFSAGTNTLEYYYAGNASYIKTRVIIKNPDFPSTGESHGNLLWKNSAGFEALLARLNRAPYTFYSSSLRQDNSIFNNLSYWDTHRSLGRRLRADNVSACALIAKIEGWDYTAEGKTLSFGQYAKEMLLCNGATIDPIGFEISHSGNAIPSRELYYRGYYDVNHVFSLCMAYDLFAANFKSTQVSGGMTAIEDYFIRDCLAWFAFDAMMQEGNYTGQPYPNPGMWGTARNIGGLMVAITMPTYNTPYRGTSGFTDVGSPSLNLPFPDIALTWKQVFHDNNLTLTGYPNLNYRFGVEDYLCNALGQYIDRAGYFDQPLMSHCFAMAANLSSMWGSASYPNFLLCATNANAGELDGLVNPEENPVFATNPWLTNHRFATFASASLPVMQAEDSGSDQSDDRQIFRAVPAIALILFEDDWQNFVEYDNKIKIRNIRKFTGIKISSLQFTGLTTEDGFYLITEDGVELITESHAN